MTPRVSVASRRWACDRVGAADPGARARGDPLLGRRGAGQQQLADRHGQRQQAERRQGQRAGVGEAAATVATTRSSATRAISA